MDRPLAPSRNRVNQADPPKLTASDLLALPRTTRLNHVHALLVEKTRQIEKTGELGHSLTKQEAELKALYNSLKQDENYVGGGSGANDEAVTLKQMQSRLEQFRGENEGLLSSLVDFDSRITLSHAPTARIPASTSQSLLPRSISGGLELHEGKAIAETLVTEVRRLQALVNERDESLARISTDKHAERERYGALEGRLRELEVEKNRIAEVSWDYEVKAQETQAAHDESLARATKYEKENQKAQFALSKLRETSDAQKAENERLAARVTELEEERKVEGAKMRAEQQRIKRDNSDLRETLNALHRGKKSFGNLRGAAGGNTPSPLGAGSQRRRVPVAGEGDDEELQSPQGDDVFGADTIGRKRRRGPGVEADGNILDAGDQYSDFDQSFDASFDNASPLRNLGQEGRAAGKADTDVEHLQAALAAARAEIDALKAGVQSEEDTRRQRAGSILSDTLDSDTSVIAPRRGGRTVSRGVRGIRRGGRGARGSAAFSRQDRSFSNSPQHAFASSPLSTPGRPSSIISDGDRFNSLDRPLEFGEGFEGSPESINKRPDSFYGDAKPLDLDLGDDLGMDDDDDDDEILSDAHAPQYVDQAVMTDPMEEETQYAAVGPKDASLMITPIALGFPAIEIIATPRRVMRQATPETETDGTTEFEDARSEASTPREDTIRVPAPGMHQGRAVSPLDSEIEAEYADARSVGTLTPSASTVDLHRLSISSDDFYSMAPDSSADEDSDREEASRRPRAHARSAAYRPRTIEVIREVPVPGPERIVIKEIPVERVVERIVEVPGPERIVGKEIYIDVPGPERIVIKEVPVERIVEREIQVPGPERIVEKKIFVDVPGPERIVTQEVPIERIVEREVPVPGPERIVEKEIFVNVPGPERIVTKEVPIERIVEREVQVPGPERIVEVEKEIFVDVPGPERLVIQEVPVERIVEREVHVPGPERIVEVEKQVIVNVPGPERIVINEVPIERIVEREVQVPGPERVVEVEREVIVNIPGPERVVEVPVERIVEREVQVPGPVQEVQVPGPERVVEVEKEVIVNIPGPERIVIKEVPVERIVEVVKQVDIPGPERIVIKEVPTIQYVDREVVRETPGPERIVEVPTIQFVDRVVTVEGPERVEYRDREIVREVLVPGPQQTIEVPVIEYREREVLVDRPVEVIKVVEKPVEVVREVYVDRPVEFVKTVERPRAEHDSKATQTEQEDASPLDPPAAPATTLSAVLAAPVPDLGLYRISAAQDYEFLRTAPVSPTGSRSGSIGRCATIDDAQTGSPTRHGARVRPALLVRGESEGAESSAPGLTSTTDSSAAQARAPPRMNLPPPPDMPPPAALPLKRMSSGLATPGRPMSPPPLEYLQRATSPRLAPAPFGSASASSSRRQQNASTPAHIGRRHPSSASLQAIAAESRKYDSVKLSREAVKRKADVVVIATSRGSREQSLRTASAASTRSSEAGPLPSLPCDDALQYDAAGSVSTDPLVITAITQTMIGEYMWKDTRRAFSTEMSGNRHKRYCWIHPYSKALHWSQSDPAAAEGKAKSVFISGIKVISSAEPGGHGMWRETIVVATPTRDIHLTAPNEARHDAWLTALGYLVGRPSQSTMSGRASIIPSDVTQTPIRNDYTNDFGMRYSGSRNGTASLRSLGTDFSTPKAMPRSQSSMSTHRKSRAAQLSLAGPSTMGRIRSGIATSDFEEISRSEGRLSWEDGYEGLDNVRACCNGEHDLGSLAHRHSHQTGSKRAGGDTHSIIGSFRSRRARSPSKFRSLSRRSSNASGSAVLPPRLMNAGGTPAHRAGRSASRASSRPASPSIRA